LREINAAPFDIIYVDARKAEYIEYVEIILERQLLAENGIILADDSMYPLSLLCIGRGVMNMTAIHLGLVADRSPTNPHSAREDIEYSLQHADNVHEFNEWAVKVCCLQGRVPRTMLTRSSSILDWMSSCFQFSTG
jgi:hypothetical protein